MIIMFLLIVMYVSHTVALANWEFLELIASHAKVLTAKITLLCVRVLMAITMMELLIAKNACLSVCTVMQRSVLLAQVISEQMILQPAVACQDFSITQSTLTARNAN